MGYTETQELRDRLGERERDRERTHRREYRIDGHMCALKNKRLMRDSTKETKVKDGEPSGSLEREGWRGDRKEEQNKTLRVGRMFRCRESPSAVCVSSVQLCASGFPSPTK